MITQSCIDVFFLFLFFTFFLGVVGALQVCTFNHVGNMSHSYNEHTSVKIYNFFHPCLSLSEATQSTVTANTTKRLLYLLEHYHSTLEMGGMHKNTDGQWHCNMPFSFFMVRHTHLERGNKFFSLNHFVKMAMGKQNTASCRRKWLTNFVTCW